MSTKAELEAQIADLKEQLEARQFKIQQDAQRITDLTTRAAETSKLRDRCNRYETIIDQLSDMINIVR